MSIVQALLIGIVAALTNFEGGWLGECKLREPVVTGFLVGVILGDPTKGLIIGAQLQVMWMGATAIGPTAGLNIGTGGTIGAAAALVTGTGAEVAIAFGVPVAVVMQFLETLLMTAYSGFMHKVDEKIDVLDDKYPAKIHYLCGVLSFLMYTILTFIVMYFGNDMMSKIVENLPEWALKGMGAVGMVLPAMGFAMLLDLLLSTELIPYFVIGFICAAYLKMDMVAVCGVSIAMAAIIYMLKSDILKLKSDKGQKDGWEN